jgi:hypothetical protein
MEAYKEHPCPPARYEEQEGDPIACPSLGARRFWCSSTVNEHTVSHGTVSFSPPPSSRAVTASFPSRGERGRKYQHGSTQGTIEQVALNDGRQY